VRVVLQRVREASVTVQQEVVAGIGSGVLLLLGIARSDGEAEALWLAEKVAGLRIFDDPSSTKGGGSLSLAEVGGEALVISQFTLLAKTERGRRPSYSDAAPGVDAEPLYRCFVRALASHVSVKTGVFGADMQVSLINDGPLTLVLSRGEGEA